MRNMLTQFWGKAKTSETGAEDLTEITPRRRSVVPLWRRRSTLVAMTLFTVSLVGGAGAWAVKSGWTADTYTQTKWAMIKTSAEQGFTVEDVLVTGRVETARADLLDAMGVARGAPILAYDFQEAKARVENLPWVLSARIERLLPDTLVVHLTERRPMALWQSQGQFALIDEEGEIITRDDLGRFANLIHVVGTDAPDHVGGLLELLETQPELQAQVKAAVRVGGRRWDLILAGGVDVRLPESGAPQALARLAAFEHETGVLGRAVKVLDLRAPDRVIVRRDKPNDGTISVPKRNSGQET